MSDDRYCSGHDGLGYFRVITVEWDDNVCGCTGTRGVVRTEVCGHCGKPFAIVDEWDLFALMEADIEAGLVS